jgi:hypothetical protein
VTDPGTNAPDRPDPKAEERERRQANLILLVGFVIVVGLGVWFVNAMFDQGRMDDCLSQGRRDCVQPVEAPAR